MGFMKKFFGAQQAHKDEGIASATSSNAATPATSNAATPITSPAGSVIDVDLHATSINNRYHNDPMRISKRPDTIGNFLDPMGGHGSYSVSKDVTNTGA